MLILEPRCILLECLVKVRQELALLLMIWLVCKNDRCERLRLSWLQHLRHRENVAQPAAWLLISPVIHDRALLRKLNLLVVHAVRLHFNALAVKKAHGQHLIHTIENAPERPGIVSNCTVDVRLVVQGEGDVFVTRIQRLRQHNSITDPCRAAFE